MSKRAEKARKKFVPIVEEAPPPSPAIHGRSASWNPANRFEKLHVDLGDADVVQIDPTDEEEKPRRYTVYSAKYRLVLKGADRGKWECTVVAEADAPLVTVETVVRGVMRRSGDMDEPERMSGDEARDFVIAAAR